MRNQYWKEPPVCYFYWLLKAGVLGGCLLELVRNANVLALPQTCWMASSGGRVPQSVFKKLFCWLGCSLKSEDHRAHVFVFSIPSLTGGVCSLWRCWWALEPLLPNAGTGESEFPKSSSQTVSLDSPPTPTPSKTSLWMGRKANLRASSHSKLLNDTIKESGICPVPIFSESISPTPAKGQGWLSSLHENMLWNVDHPGPEAGFWGSPNWVWGLLIFPAENLSIEGFIR